MKIELCDNRRALIWLSESDIERYSLHFSSMSLCDGATRSFLSGLFTCLENLGIPARAPGVTVECAECGEKDIIFLVTAPETDRFFDSADDALAALRLFLAKRVADGSVVIYRGGEKWRVGIKKPLPEREEALLSEFCFSDRGDLFR